MIHGWHTERKFNIWYFYDKTSRATRYRNSNVSLSIHFPKEIDASTSQPTRLESQTNYRVEVTNLAVIFGSRPSFPKPLLQKNLYPRNWIVNPLTSTNSCTYNIGRISDLHKIYAFNPVLQYFAVKMVFCFERVLAISNKASLSSCRKMCFIATQRSVNVSDQF